MVTPEKMLSIGGRHALQDMVELEMYLVAQSQQTPWPMLPRSTKKLHERRKPYSPLVESIVAKELIVLGYIEASSSLTFVVSQSGYQFYVREMTLSGVPDSER
jgi:hypothetical protein